MKILITHVDMDGFGGNILYNLFNKELGFDAIYNMNYGLENTDEAKALINDDNDIIMMDLSIPESSYNEWKDRLGSFRVFDHHTSSEYLSKDFLNIWDTERCGTRIFWEDYVKPIILEKGNYSKDLIKRVDHLVRVIDTYDRWQEESDLWINAKRLMKINMSIPSKFCKYIAEKVITTDADNWTEEELEMIRDKEETENKILTYMENEYQLRNDNSGHTFMLVKVDYTPAVSVCSTEFLKKHPEIDYLIIYNKWMKKMSWRTKKDIDLTGIHGVNGHKKAAGSEGGEYILNLSVLGNCPKWVKVKERKSRTPIIEKYLG